MPPVLKLTVGVEREGLEKAHFEAALWPHAKMFPLLVGMAAYDGLTGSVEGDERETIGVQLNVQTKAGVDLVWSDVATGERSAAVIAESLYEKLDDLVNNPLGPVEVSAIDLSMEVNSGWQLSALEGVELDRTRFRAGDMVTVELKLRDYWGALSSRTVSLQLPESLERGEMLHLLVASGERADELTGALKQRQTRLDAYFQAWEDRRLSGRIYLILYTEESNLSVEGIRMPDLPPSVIDSLSAKVTDMIRDWDQVRIVSETVVPVEGVFRGEDLINFKIE